MKVTQKEESYVNRQVCREVYIGKDLEERKNEVIFRLPGLKRNLSEFELIVEISKDINQMKGDDNEWT